MLIDIVHWLLFGTTSGRFQGDGSCCSAKHHKYQLGNETAWHLGTTLGQILSGSKTISVKGRLGNVFVFNLVCFVSCVIPLIRPKLEIVKKKK